MSNDPQRWEGLGLPPGTWWLAVHFGGPEPLPQMYRADQILGIPATGLAPTDAVVVAEGPPSQG